MPDPDASQTITGHCLCGAVTVRARVQGPILRACHCDMCRAHTSAMFMSIETLPGSVEVSGPATSYRSSDWAERGFCSVCGSTLWYGTVADGERHLSAGLFQNAAGVPLAMEFYADNTPDGYALSGTHPKLTKDETIRLFTQDD
ncbi:MAG: GFA family protein [Pseudomonadota bacterium]